MNSNLDLSSRLSNWVSNATNYGRSPSERVSVLDGWRGIAIIIVLISHFSAISEAFPFDRVLLGRLGVDFFFVLSGLLMANILFVKRVPLKTFYQRRISRILPVFFLYVSLVYLVAWIIGRTSETPNYLYTLFFLRSHVPIESDIWRSDIPISHLWSLNVEEHCYVILSIITLFLFLRNREYWALFAIGCGAMIVHYLFIRYPDLAVGRYGIRTETAASHLMLSAGYFLVRDRFAPYVKSWMPLLATGIGIFCYSHYAPWYANWLMSPFFFAFAVNHIEQAPRFALACLSFRPLQLIGIWSYSIYLWQEPFYQFSSGGTSVSPGKTIVFLLLALAVGIFSFYYIENPIRRYLNQRWA